MSFRSGKNEFKNEGTTYYIKIIKGNWKFNSKVPVKNAKDLSLAYSPGVAEPCKEIYEDTETVYDYTMKGNMVAVVTMVQLC